MKNLFALSIILLSYSVSNAQTGAVPKGEFWLGAQFAIPVGELADKIDRNLGYGGNLGFVLNPSKSNNFFQIGADLGLEYMGKDKKEIGGIPMKTTSGLFTAHLVMRLRIQTESFIKPYVDILGGGKFIFVTTKYNNNVIATALDIEDNTIFGNQSASVWSYGLGGGISIRRETIGLDIRILYLAGGQVSFISPENFQQDDQGEIYYESVPIKRTDLIFPQVGFSLDF
jgi:hypothetical protein